MNKNNIYVGTSVLTESEIEKMINVFNFEIENAKTDNKINRAYINEMLFIVGLNVGIRTSELRELRWNFFFDDNHCWKNYYIINSVRPQKATIKLNINDKVRNIINKYIEKYPIKNLNNYIFSKNNKPFTVQVVWGMIRKTAEKAGINKNIGTHTLRKTWGCQCLENAENKETALRILQYCFNHFDIKLTMDYLEIDSSKVYNIGYVLKTKKI